MYSDKTVTKPLFEKDYFGILSNAGITEKAVSIGNANSVNTFKSKDNPTWNAAKFGHPKPAYAYFKKFDLGNGFFFKENFTLDNFSHPMHTANYPMPYLCKYTGPYLPAPSYVIRNLILDAIPWPSQDDVPLELFGLGGSAIAKTLPTRSHMSLGVSLGELRKDGLPKMLGLNLLDRRGSMGKNIGSEYLNFQFGVMPLVRDLRDLLTVVRDSAKILEEYNRLSGKHIRRRYNFPESVKTFDITSDSQVPIVPSASNTSSGSGTGWLRAVGTYKVNAWFSGAYLYAIPVDDDLIGKLRKWESEANRLLGLRITPELLWNVTSWSWLLDWFATIGDVITNISYLGQDGLVLHYGYIMRHIDVEAEILTTDKPRGSSKVLKCTARLEQKARQKASPYGFGLNPNSFTLKQWSILGALGLTKAPKSLF